MATTANTALVPTVTGNPAADTLIRNGIIAASGAAAGIIVTWLNAHGFNDPNLTLMVSGAVAALLSGVAATAWGWWQTHQSQAAIVNNTVHAALTGEVPESIISKATEAQAQAVQASPTASVVSKSAEPPAPEAPKS
jgi:hypothetical protein